MGALFSRVIIVGTGLLGGSVALAVRHVWPDCGLVGVVRSEANLDYLRRTGMVDVATRSLSEAISAVRTEFSDGKGNEAPLLVLFAVPVGAIPGLVERTLVEIRRYGGKNFWVLTDVGSTKQTLMDAVRSQTFPANACFVGSHPIAGSERSGPQNACAQLFDGRVVIVVREKNGGMASLPVGVEEQVAQFWQELGARPVFMTAGEHDRILARTSHLPHLVSVALAGLLEDRNRIATGTGWRDMTRLAASSDEVWTDILQSNRIPLSAAISELMTALATWKDVLDRNDRESIAALLKRSARICRERLEDGNHDEVREPVGEQWPGGGNES